ncbi:MAG: hypothetical protein ABH846_00240, partial [Patescibacteria group bacterium]
EIKTTNSRIVAGKFSLDFPAYWNGIQVGEDFSGFGSIMVDDSPTYEAPGHIYMFYFGDGMEDDNFVFSVMELETQYKHNEAIPDDQTFFAETIDHVYYWGPMDGATQQQLEEVPNIVKTISF